MKMVLPVFFQFCNIFMLRIHVFAIAFYFLWKYLFEMITALNKNRTDEYFALQRRVLLEFLL